MSKSIRDKHQQLAMLNDEEVKLREQLNQIGKEAEKNIQDSFQIQKKIEELIYIEGRAKL